MARLYRIALPFVLALPFLLVAQEVPTTDASRAAKAIKETLRAQQLLIDAQQLLQTVSEANQQLTLENQRLRGTLSDSEAAGMDLNAKVIEMQERLNRSMGSVSEMQKSNQAESSDAVQARALAESQRKLALAEARILLLEGGTPKPKARNMLDDLDAQIQALNTAIGGKDKILQEANAAGILPRLVALPANTQLSLPVERAPAERKERPPSKDVTTSLPPFRSILWRSILDDLLPKT